ncbi:MULTISPECIES: endolytic transglycosylase MltG [Bacteria]|uniref:endolytic transglycosylase MltG n=1 Tax=Bacteria TaxID=2 RepID=UPI003C7B8C28
MAEMGEEPREHATIDDLFRQESEASSHETKPRRRRTGCLVALLIVLVLLGGLAAGGVWVWNTYGDKISEALGWGPSKDYEEGQATGNALITISAGDTGADISTKLYDAGVTKTKSVFYDMMVSERIAKTFYPGVYQLKLKMSAAAALAALNDPANKKENSVLLNEGNTVAQILAKLSEGLDRPLEEFTAAAADPKVYGVNAPSLEGWLFPALYEFAPEDTATDIIAKLVDRTRQSLASAGVPAGDEERVLTIASIIEREAGAADFGKVSRVVANRLAQDMKLQMDSTAQYGYGEIHDGSVSTSEQAQNDDNPWNTYVHAGLPATPIANPGDAAIEAAMHPADGPWLYFVTVNLNTGETQFSTTYEEHLGYVKQWQEWCSANPDSGC